MMPRPIPIFSAVLLCLALLFSAAAPARDMPKDISLGEAEALVKKEPFDLVIVDVRTKGEYAAGHLPNSKNIDFFGGRFEKDMLELPQKNKILVYCRSGRRSAEAAAFLKEKGYGNVLHMKDGFQAWEKAGYPVKKDKK